MLNHSHMLVIGASGRFLAQSAVLAGCRVSVVDLFHDSDTQQLCTMSNRFSTAEGLVAKAYRVNALHELRDGGATGLRETLKGFPPENESLPLTIVFAGGAENYAQFFGSDFWSPAIVTGPSVSSIQRLLSWPTIRGVCQQHQIMTPRSICQRDESTDDSTTWLQKQIRSGGGLQISCWNTSEPVDFDAGFYLQEKIEGATLSGCYVAGQNEDDAEVRLLGACQQLPNEDASDFRYQGSLGPVDLSERVLQEMERVGNCIASEFSITGIFGIDFVCSADRLYLVDINPRVTASAELIERYYRRGRSDFTILEAHLDATLRGCVATPMKEFGGTLFSKTIVYWESSSALMINEAMVEYFQSAAFITDVPTVGTTVGPGHPLVTVHAEAENREALVEVAAKRIGELRDRLVS